MQIYPRLQLIQNHWQFLLELSKEMMIPVSEKWSVLFFQCFWEGKANLSANNVILTWGSLQVLHKWELFDCTAYNHINPELSPGSWLMNMHDWSLSFFCLIHQNSFHPRVLRSFTQESWWVGFTCSHMPCWKGSKVSAALNPCVQLQVICWAACSCCASSSHLAKLPRWDPPPEQSSWDVGMPEYSCSTNYRTDKMVCVVNHPRHSLNINLKWLSANVQPLV